MCRTDHTQTLMTAPQVIQQAVARIALMLMALTCYALPVHSWDTVERGSE